MCVECGRDRAIDADVGALSQNHRIEREEVQRTIGLDGFVLNEEGNVVDTVVSGQRQGVAGIIRHDQ